MVLRCQTCRRAISGRCGQRLAAFHISRRSACLRKVRCDYDWESSHSDSQMQTWMRRPTSVIGRKADMARTCQYVRY